MTPFAAVVRWSGQHAEFPAPPPGVPEGVLAGGTDSRRVVVVPGATLAVAVRQTVTGETPDHGLFVDQRQQWAAVGDVTLYDREDVAARLGIKGHGQTDLALLARLLRQWGPAAAGQVAGDFALVIWDWRSRRVHAIRDQLGIRSLFYRERKGGMELAGSVAQLLALDDRDRAIDEVMAFEYLTNTFSSLGRSFFAHIGAVRPAFWLDAGPRGARQLEYWQPSFEPFLGTYRDAVEEWQRRFRTAVRCRLQSHAPVAAYLSGGFDSSSIVGAAHDVLVEAGETTSRPLALSAAFPGLPCDEETYRQAVLQRCTSFDSFTWDGREPNPDDLENPLPAAPGLRQGIGRSRKREYGAMRERGARVLLTGDGGDALGFGYGAFAELIRRGRLGTLAGELHALGSWRRARGILRREVEDFLPFSRATPPVAWLGPALKGLGGRGAVHLARPGGPSRVQAHTADALRKPFSVFAIDMGVTAGAANGVQVRVPFCDIRLVNLVLGIPWEHRLPGGDFRRLHRDGTAPFLPAAVRSRRGKAGFDVMLGHQIRANMSRITGLLGDRQWLSERYVDQTVTRTNFEKLLAKDPDRTQPAEWRHLWRIAVFEVWLRHLFGYSPEPCAVRS